MSDINSKIEKYYNYIINDIVKETKVRYDSRVIFYKTPFWELEWASVDFKYRGQIKDFKSAMGDYLKEKYGARDEDIPEIISRYFFILMTDWREMMKS
jgi:hypothetical protein